MIQRFTCAVLSACLLGCGWVIGAAAQGNDLEYKIKAAFMLNFAKFTTWYDPHVPDGQDFPLCIVGDDPFGSALNGVEEKQVGGKQVRVLRSKELNSTLDQCRILFVSASENTRLESIFTFADEHQIVTVSDIVGFARAGGVFELKDQDGRLSFIVNNSKAKDNGVQISSALLNLAVGVL